MGVGGQRHAPAALPPGKRLGTHCIEGWITSGIPDIHHPQNISDLKLGRNSHSSKYMLYLTMGNMHSRLETCLLKGGDHLKTSCSRSGKHSCILQDNILIIL